MTLPASIRVNTSAPFPATVKGSGLVAISKLANIWTVSINFNGLAQTKIVPDPTNTYILAWNAITNVSVMLQLGSAVSPANKVTTVLTAAGPYAALPTDDIIIVKQTVGALFNVTVDWSARAGKPLTVVDGKGDAATNNITVTPKTGQTQLAIVNYVYTIDGNGGSVTLTPLPDGTGAY